MTRLEDIKAALVREEADIEEKMKRIERRMQEVTDMHMAVKQGEVELREKEKKVSAEKARLVKIAKTLSHKEGVLTAFESSLKEEEQRLQTEKAAFVAAKEEWLSVHPSPPSPPAYRTPLDSTLASCDSPVFPH
jgi:chromosome segregation ATPase